MRIALLIATLGMTATYMEENPGDQGGGGAGEPAPDPLAGVRGKYTGQDGAIDTERLLGDFHNTQSEYNRLRNGGNAPETYQFAVPEAYANTIGEIDFQGDVYQKLGGWGKKNGVSQEAMDNLHQLFLEDQHNGISQVLSDREKFKNTLGPNWEETQNKLFNVAHNMTGTGLQEGATPEQQEAHGKMNALLQELTNFPEGVALLQAMEANSRDPMAGVAGGYTPPTGPGTAQDRTDAHKAWMDARNKYNKNDEHPEVKAAHAKYRSILERQNAAGMLKG